MFNKFFPIVDTCLSSEDIGLARRSCAMVLKWRFLRSVFQRLLGEIMRTNVDVHKRDEQTDRQTNRQIN